MVEKKIYLPTVDALKFIASFVVVCCHFEHGYFHVSIPYREIAVPIFCFFSMFVSNLNSSFDSSGVLFRRVARLLWPFWGWGFIYSVVALLSGSFTASQFVCQMLVGHSFCQPLYFLFLIILYTVIVYLIEKWARNSFRRIIIIVLSLCVVMLLLQYSAVNYRLFSKLPVQYGIPLGRMAELLPAALFGYLFAKIYKRFDCQPVYLAVGMSMVVAAIGLKKLGLNNPSGFMYSGLPLLLSSCGMCVAISSIHCKSLVKLSSLFKTSSCIYYVHVLVGSIMAFTLTRIGVSYSFASDWIVVSMAALVVSFCLQRIKMLKMLVL